jgi:hypothetical protein
MASSSFIQHSAHPRHVFRRTPSRKSRSCNDGTSVGCNRSTGRNCGRWLGGESRDALSGTRQRMALLNRKGQRGNVYQPQYLERWNPQAPAHGRFWIDVQGGERKRKTVSLGRCATEWAARLRLREYIERAGVNTRNAFGQVPVPGTTFRQQAESWIESVSIRKRRPAKPATI